MCRGVSSNDNDEVVQPAGKTIRSIDDGQRRAEEGHARLKVNAAFFYAYNGLVVSTDPGWIQSLFGMLTGLFNQVGLRNNVRKTVGMVCQPCWAAGVRADKA